MLNKKIIFTLIFLIIAIGALSSVSANDLNSTEEVIAIDENTVETPVDDVDDALSAADENEVYGDEKVNGTFEVINTDVDYNTGSASFRLIDSNGTGIANATVNLDIKGKIFGFNIDKTTDENGTVTFDYHELEIWKTDSSGVSYRDKLTAGTYDTTLKIKDSDINVKSINEKLTIKPINISATVSNLIFYVGGPKQATMTFINPTTGLPVRNEKLIIRYEELLVNQTGQTDSNGKITLNLNGLSQIGTYKVTATFDNAESVNPTKIVKTVTVKEVPTIKATKLTTTYNSGKYFQVKVLDKDGKGVKGVKLRLKIYTGSSYITKYRTTNSNGVVKYSINSLSKGTHKVVISSSVTNFTAKSVSSSIKINAKKLTIYTKSTKSSKYSKLEIKVGTSQKNLYNNVKINVKIYTGSKYKSFNLVTGKYKTSKGICYIITNKFTAGTHKVKITINGNYQGTKTTSLVLTSAAVKAKPKVTKVLTNGKEKKY